MSQESWCPKTGLRFVNGKLQQLFQEKNDGACEWRFVPEVSEATLSSIIPEPIILPIPMILHCPNCGAQHIDEKQIMCPIKDEYSTDLVVCGKLAGHEGECVRATRVQVEDLMWKNPPHKSHLCLNCGIIWRPASLPTTGVVAIDSRGEKDSWSGESEMLAEFRQMALAGHKNHANVGSRDLLKEFSACRMTFCQRRYKMCRYSEKEL